MHGWFAVLFTALSLASTPAVAAPCSTRGTVETAVAFPTNRANDVPFARAMVPLILPDRSNAVPTTLNCLRATVHTVLGDYVIGGENDDAFPRLAFRADGKPGPIAYLASPFEAKGAFALVVHRPGQLTVIKRFYAGIPTDCRLSDDILAALADDANIIAYDAERRVVSYGFVPISGIPPPAPSGSGPQVMIPKSGDPQTLDMADGMRHRPSGFACPSTFAPLQVLLVSIDPKAEYLSCSYRAGADLAFQPDAPIRYQITLARPSAGMTPRSVFDQLTASARSQLHIRADHPPPLLAGPSPAPQFAVFWDTEDEGVQGVWVGAAGGWIVSVRAHYPPASANDAEAGNVARALFVRAAEQVKQR